MNTPSFLRRADLGRRITFRFGLTGTCWGETGPAVLIVHGEAMRPALLRRLVGPLLAAGFQVIELDHPAGDGLTAERPSPAALALAIGEAAVEIRNLDAIVGYGSGAAAALDALADGLPAERAVLVNPQSAEETRLKRMPAIPVLSVASPDAPDPMDQITTFLTGRDMAMHGIETLPAAA
jgi:alpha-beta hydrolase superfamily lysophospholipase